MNAETPLQNLIRLAVSKPGTRLFRNTVGTFKTAQGTYVNCGLAAGSPDLVGWTSVVVTPAMVGKRLAVFTAIEVKAPGARTDADRLAAQENFMIQVLAYGGRAGFASTVERALEIVRGK